MKTLQNSQSNNPLAVAQALSSRIAAVNEFAIAVNRSLNLEEILRVVGKSSKWLIDFDHLSLYLTQASYPRLVNLFGPPLSIDQIQGAQNLPVQRVLNAGQPQIVSDPQDMFWADHQSALIVPLEQQQQRFGAIIFSSKRPQAYTIDDVRISYLMALQLSSAIRNAERFEEINRLYDVIALEQERSEHLLLNILPREIADELKRTGKVQPVYYESASVLFTDFSDFTQVSQSFTPAALVDELDLCFSYFDRVADKYGLEKLKTIGDSYMCVGGIPTPNKTHAVDIVLAAVEIEMFMRLRRAYKQMVNQPYWNVRIGIHSGGVMAGVIGRKKFAYDIWGNTVNTASRMESAGMPGKINISRATYELVKDFFEVDYRGKIAAKNKGSLDMFWITGIKESLAFDPQGFLPNGDFIDLYLATQAASSAAEPQKWITLAA